MKVSGKCDRLVLSSADLYSRRNRLAAKVSVLANLIVFLWCLFAPIMMANPWQTSKRLARLSHKFSYSFPDAGWTPFPDERGFYIGFVFNCLLVIFLVNIT